MDARVKAIWLAALRSGDYKQAKNTLRVNGRFCCLGVLCNLHAIEHPGFAASEESPHCYDGSEFIPGPNVVKWAGLYTVSGSRNETGVYGDGSKTLAFDNDRGKSFLQIADTIEREF